MFYFEGANRKLRVLRRPASGYLFPWRQQLVSLWAETCVLKSDQFGSLERLRARTLCGSDRNGTPALFHTLLTPQRDFRRPGWQVCQQQELLTKQVIVIFRVAKVIKQLSGERRGAGELIRRQTGGLKPGLVWSA